MAVSKFSASFPCAVQKVWTVVTTPEEYLWRSDLDGGEVLSETQFVEIPRDGDRTLCTVTVSEPCKRWELDLENDDMSGHWTGLFSEKDGVTTVEVTEDVTAKKLHRRPFVSAYLKKRQENYAADLRKALGQP